MERDDNPIERHLADALRRLSVGAVVPPVDDRRVDALLSAFDAAQAQPGPRRSRQYWYLGAFAAAAAAIIVAGIGPATLGRRGHLPADTAKGPHSPSSAARDVRLEPPNDFVIVPAAAGLPPMESGTLVRLDVPVAVLSSYGVTPPAGRGPIVTADFIVAQDGLTRAVRVVAP